MWSILMILVLFISLLFPFFFLFWVSCIHFYKNMLLVHWTFPIVGFINILILCLREQKFYKYSCNNHMPQTCPQCDESSLQQPCKITVGDVLFNLISKECMFYHFIVTFNKKTFNIIFFYPSIYWYWGNI